MADTPRIKVDIDVSTPTLADAIVNVDRFAMALGRVRESSLRTFASLQELSQRYQQQGFLGQKDQQTLERSLRQWERAEQIIGMRVQGAQEANDLALQTMNPLSARSVSRAVRTQHTLQQFSQDQMALERLRARVGNLWGNIPGPTSPWAPRLATAAGPNPAAAWGGVSGAMAANINVGRPAAWGGVQGAMQANIGAAQPPLPPFSPWAPLQGPAPAPGWATPTGPFSPWPGSFGQRAWGYTRNFFQDTPWSEYGHRAYNAVHGPARAALGVTAGIGVYQTLTEAMDLYRQRAHGVVAVGMQLDLNFTRVGNTIDHLRDRYKVLAQDSIAAMRAMGRYTGHYDAGQLDAAMQMAAGYGIDPAQAASLAESMSLLGTGSRPLARFAAGARMGFGGGNLPWSMGMTLDEGAAMLASGGAARLPMDIGMVGAWGGLIANLGQRYQMPGQTAATFGRLGEALGSTDNPAVAAMQFRAVQRWHQQRLAQGQGSMVRIGTGKGALTVDLRDIVGQQIALENARDNPELLEQMRQLSVEYGGTNPTQQAMFFQQYMLGGRFNATQSEQMRRGLLTREGIATLGRQPLVESEAAEAQARQDYRDASQEFASQLAQAMSERGLENIGRPLVTAASELRQALATLGETIRDGTVHWEQIAKAVTTPSGSTWGLIGAMMALGSTSAFGQAMGLGMLGGAAGYGAGDWFSEKLGNVLEPLSRLPNALQHLNLGGVGMTHDPMLGIPLGPTR